MNDHIIHNKNTGALWRKLNDKWEISNGQRRQSRKDTSNGTFYNPTQQKKDDKRTGNNTISAVVPFRIYSYHYGPSHIMSWLPKFGGKKAKFGNQSKMTGQPEFCAIALLTILCMLTSKLLQGNPHIDFAPPLHWQSLTTTNGCMSLTFST